MHDWFPPQQCMSKPHAFRIKMARQASFHICEVVNQAWQGRLPMKTRKSGVVAKGQLRAKNSLLQGCPTAAHKGLICSPGAPMQPLLPLSLHLPPSASASCSHPGDRAAQPMMLREPTAQCGAARGPRWGSSMHTQWKDVVGRHSPCMLYSRGGGLATCVVQQAVGCSPGAHGFHCYSTCWCSPWTLPS